MAPKRSRLLESWGILKARQIQQGFTEPLAPQNGKVAAPDSHPLGNVPDTASTYTHLPRKAGSLQSDFPQAGLYEFLQSLCTLFTQRTLSARAHFSVIYAVKWVVYMLSPLLGVSRLASCGPSLDLHLLTLPLGRFARLCSTFCRQTVDFIAKWASYIQ